MNRTEVRFAHIMFSSCPLSYLTLFRAFAAVRLLYDYSRTAVHFKKNTAVLYANVPITTSYHCINDELFIISGKSANINIISLYEMISVSFCQCKCTDHNTIP